MRKRIFAVVACAVACAPLMANAGFEIDPVVAKSLAPKPAEPATAAATLLAAQEPRADAIAKIAESSKPAAASAQAAPATVTTAAAPVTASTPAAATVGGPTPPAPVPIQQWQILPKDLTIYATLRRWGKEANWQVSWEVPVDYPATLTSTFSGSFEDATEAVLTAYKNSEFPLQGCFYQANKVLRVTRYVANSRDCE